MRKKARRLRLAYRPDHRTQLAGLVQISSICSFRTLRSQTITVALHREIEQFTSIGSICLRVNPILEKDELGKGAIRELSEGTKGLSTIGNTLFVLPVGDQPGDQLAARNAALYPARPLPPNASMHINRAISAEATQHRQCRSLSIRALQVDKVVRQPNDP